MDAKEAISLIQLANGATIIKGRYLHGLAGKNKTKPLACSGPVPVLEELLEDSTSGYSFKDVIGLGLARGDLAVVQTRDSYQLVEVLEIDVLPTHLNCRFQDLKHAVAKIDLSPLKAVMDNEGMAVHRLAMSEVTSKLDVFKEQLGGTAFNQVVGLLSSRPAAPPAAPMGATKSFEQERKDQIARLLVEKGDLLAGPMSMTDRGRMVAIEHELTALDYNPAPPVTPPYMNKPMPPADHGDVVEPWAKAELDRKDEPPYFKNG